MPATLLTTVTATQKIASGEDHQSVFEVIIFSFAELFSFIVGFHYLKHEACPRSACPAGRAKATLEIFPIEEIVNIAKEAELSSIIAQW